MSNKFNNLSMRAVMVTELWTKSILLTYIQPIRANLITLRSVYLKSDLFTLTFVRAEQPSSCLCSTYFTRRL